MPHTRLQSQVLAQRQRKPAVVVRLRATGTLGSWAKITRNGTDHGMSLFKPGVCTNYGETAICRWPCRVVPAHRDHQCRKGGNLLLHPRQVRLSRSNRDVRTKMLDLRN